MSIIDEPIYTIKKQDPKSLNFIDRIGYVYLSNGNVKEVIINDILAVYDGSRHIDTLFDVSFTVNQINETYLSYFFKKFFRKDINIIERFLNLKKSIYQTDFCSVYSPKNYLSSNDVFISKEEALKNKIYSFFILKFSYSSHFKKDWDKIESYSLE